MVSHAGMQGSFTHGCVCWGAYLSLVGRDDSHRGLGAQVRVEVHQLAVHTQHHLHLHHIHNGGAALWYHLLARNVIEHKGPKSLRADIHLVCVSVVKHRVCGTGQLRDVFCS